jgi:ABC-2 type transport system permease protein
VIGVYWPQNVTTRAGRAVAITWAFFRQGARATFSYPLAALLNQVAGVLQLVGFLFLGHLTRDSATLGSGYLAFAAVGLVAANIVGGGIVGLGQELDWAIQQGRLEMLLIEPISWRLIPLALAAWPVIYRLVTNILIFLVAWMLGASLTLDRLPALLVLVPLGVASGLAIGLLAGAVRILAKRGDPVATVYSMTAYVFAGQFFPINLFPLPLRVVSWIFPNTYLTAGMRKVLIPNSAQVYGPSPGQAMLLLLLFCAVLLPLSIWLFGRSLEVGRKYGVLAGY